MGYNHSPLPEEVLVKFKQAYLIANEPALTEWQIEKLKEAFALLDRDKATNPIRLAGHKLLRHEVHPIPEGGDQTHGSVTVERCQLLLFDAAENVS